MAVETTARKTTQSMTGTVVEYAFTFRALYSTPSDIKCIRHNSITGVDEDMVYDTEIPSPSYATDVLDYTVDVNEDGVGGIVTVAWPSTSCTITIYRETTDTQGSAYDDYNQFPADTVENDFDKRTMVTQEINETLDRTLRVPIQSTVDAELPSAEGNKYIGWNAGATALENKTIDATPSGTTAMLYLSNYASYAAAIAAIGATESVLVLDAAGAVAADTVTPATLQQIFTKKGVLTVAAGKSLTINGPIDAGIYQIFAGDGSAILGVGVTRQSCPQWWGAKADGVTDDTTAITSAITSSSIVFFPAGEYLVANGITLPTNKILHGEGAKVSQLTITSATADGVTLDTNAGRCQILNMKIYSDSSSTGAGVSGGGAGADAIREFKIDGYEIEGFLTGISILNGLNPFIGQGRLIGQGVAVANGEGIHFGNFATSLSVNLGVIQNCYASAYETGVNFDSGTTNSIIGGALENMDICIVNKGFNSCNGTWLSAGTYFLQQTAGGYGFILSNPGGLWNLTGTRSTIPIEDGYIDFGDEASQRRTPIITPLETYLPNNIKILANDATPSVKGGKEYRTGGTTTVTDFDDGVTGQIIRILADHSVKITDGTNIFLNGAADFDMVTTGTLTLICKSDNKWYELARSVNT